MSRQTGTFLDRIVERRTERLRNEKHTRSFIDVEQAAQAADPARKIDFAKDAPYVVAEVKKASPSKGLLREDFEPVVIGKAYEKGGASAISVLTEEDFFQGSLSYMTAVRREVNLPVLRKDFLFDPYQIYEARAAGADLILLIMAMLDDAQAVELKSLTESLGMTALIEVHDAEETERALRLNPELLGINNRNLKTFETSLDTTLNLLARIPAEVRVVSESGLATAADLHKLAARGVTSFLIGETFMRAAEPGEALARLIHDFREV